AGDCERPVSGDDSAQARAAGVDGFNSVCRDRGVAGGAARGHIQMTPLYGSADGDTTGRNVFRTTRRDDAVACNTARDNILYATAGHGSTATHTTDHQTPAAEHRVTTSDSAGGDKLGAATGDCGTRIRSSREEDLGPASGYRRPAGIATGKDELTGSVGDGRADGRASGRHLFRAARDDPGVNRHSTRGDRLKAQVEDQRVADCAAADGLVRIITG